MSLINAGLNTLRNQAPEGYRSNHPWDYRLRSAVLLRRRPLVRQEKQTGCVCCIRDQRLYPRSISTHRLPFRGKAGPVLRDLWEIDSVFAASSWMIPQIFGFKETPAAKIFEMNSLAEACVVGDD
jgi:hypothetical protein